MAQGEPVFRKIDCHMLRATDLDAAVAFYGQALGHQLVWRTEEAVAFRLPESDAELVVHRHLGPETDLLVRDADAAFRTLINAGAEPMNAPFDIPIGRCAVVKDPFGNRLTVLDQSKGQFVTDETGVVIGVTGNRDPT